MSRPCRWPDGGCGELVEFIPTGKIKPDGKPVMQVVNAQPFKWIIRVNRVTEIPVARDAYGPDIIAKVVDAYLDHHATCATWLTKMDREAAAKAGR
jgi:hypothetical protein